MGKGFVSNSDRIPREQFQGRETRNESIQVNREIFTHSYTSWGRGGKVERAGDLRKKTVVVDSWEDKLLENSKPRIPVEATVLLPLGKRNLRFTSFVLD